MPVPKRKTSRARRDSRQANKGLKPGAVVLCKECATPLIPHQVCTNCGFYKGRKVTQTKADRHIARAQARVETQSKTGKTATAETDSTVSAK